MSKIEGKTLFLQEMHYTLYLVYSIVLGVIALAIIYFVEVRIPSSNSVLGFEWLIPATVLLLVGLWFGFWYTVGRPLKFYEYEIRMDRFAKVFGYGDLKYSDIARIEALFPKMLVKRKF